MTETKEEKDLLREMFNERVEEARPTLLNAYWGCTTRQYTLQVGIRNGGARLRRDKRTGRFSQLMRAHQDRDR